MATMFDDIFAGSGGLANVFIDQMFGTDADFAYLTDGTYDPKTMTASGETQVNYTIKITPPSPYRQDEVDETTHIKGDMSFMISAYAVETYGEPPVGSSVTFDNKEWRITAVEPCRSGDEMAAYRIIVVKK